MTAHCSASSRGGVFAAQPHFSHPLAALRTRSRIGIGRGSIRDRWPLEPLAAAEASEVSLVRPAERISAHGKAVLFYLTTSPPARPKTPVTTTTSQVSIGNKITRPGQVQRLDTSHGLVGDGPDLSPR